MYPYREPEERTFFCERCGRFTRVTYTKDNRNLCRLCKTRETRLRNPNVSIQLADNLIVTTAVEKRIKKQAHREIPPSKSEKVADLIRNLSWIITLPSAYFIAKAILPESNYFIFLWLGGWFFITYIVVAIADLLAVKPIKERKAKIAGRVLELAEIRKKAYEEALRFYSSPEWLEVRKRVVQEEGRICAECGKKIKNDADVTVDHKYPRSKYREKELDRENLRVLCRRCNSSKGAKEFDW